MNSATKNLLAGFAMLASSTSALAQETAASTAANDAEAHNAIFEKAATSGLSPLSVGEMLSCSANWDRWVFIVESAADRAFTMGLRSELSARNARNRKVYWQRLARREIREGDNPSYFERMRADAASRADKQYANYASGSERGISVMMQSLGFCK